MAQHRTKKEKMTAQVHRIENTQLYSLSELNTEPNSKDSTSIQKNVKNNLETQQNLSFVKKDLLRTAISLAVVVTLLIVGFYFLKV